MITWWRNMKKWFAEKDVWEILNKQDEMLQQLNDLIKSLEAALVDAHRKLENEVQDKNLTIGCLLMASGGEMKLSNDLIRTMSNSSFNVDYNQSEEGFLTLQLATPTDDESLKDGENDCDGCGFDTEEGDYQ